MHDLIAPIKISLGHLGTFLRWALFSLIIGISVGVVAVTFHHGIAMATQLRAMFPWLIFLLPAAGAAIVYLYRICGMEKDRGTNRVLVAVREDQPMQLRTTPLIFLSTILTHLVGGSAGREGAALQLGGSMAAYIGRLLRLDEKDRRLMVMCGMSAAFSALFGTPITAAIFAMEVISVGVMYYAALVPCLFSALIAQVVSHLMGGHGEHFDVTGIPDVTLLSIGQSALMGVLTAVLAILFCYAMHHAPQLYQRFSREPLVRAALGGALLIGLTLLAGSQDYNGAGSNLIVRALSDGVGPEAFVLKILFTAVTLGAGFRGGEIVPALATGACFGCVAAPLIGLSPSFGGALAMVSVFCGATNCPISSVLLAFELFGGEGLPLIALCCGVSFMLSGYYGLYSEQKIVYSKFRPEYLDRKAH